MGLMVGKEMYSGLVNNSGLLVENRAGEGRMHADGRYRCLQTFEYSANALEIPLYMYLHSSEIPVPVRGTRWTRAIPHSE